MREVGYVTSIFKIGKKIGTGWVRRPSGQLLYFRAKHIKPEQFHWYFGLKRDDKLSYEVGTNRRGMEAMKIEIIL